MSSDEGMGSVSLFDRRVQACHAFLTTVPMDTTARLRKALESRLSPLVIKSIHTFMSVEARKKR